MNSFKIKNSESSMAVSGKRKNKQWNIVRVAVVLLTTILTSLLSASCGKEKIPEAVKKLVESGAENVMLMDYFYQETGTEETDGYYEIVLYAIVDPETKKMSTDEVKMAIYTEGGLRSEKVEEKNVPYEAYERAYEVVKDYDMPDWSDKSRLTALEGALHVCKFPWKEEYIRVTSDAMPKKGEEAFNALRTLLEEY